MLCLCRKMYGCDISGLAFVRGMLVRFEIRWLYRDVTRQTKNCSVWSSFESVLPLWWWPVHLSRDNSGGSATAGIRAASVHQSCWNLKNWFRYKNWTNKVFIKLNWFRQELCIECKALGKLWELLGGYLLMVYLYLTFSTLHSVKPYFCAQSTF